MSGVIPLFPHVPSWCTEGELFSYISLIDGLSDHGKSAPSYKEHRMDFHISKLQKLKWIIKGDTVHEFTI